MGRKRGDVMWQELLPWIIGAFVLVLMFVIYAILSGKLTGAGDFLKNLFGFGP